jgi:flavin reductase (DIM6/NTAB) family NADH-FMN oxidoreductase RutF
MGPAIRSLGTRSGRDEDKLAGLNLDTRPADEIGAPLLAGALVNLECRLAAQLETGDHTIFVGEVLAAHLAGQIPGRLLNFGPGLYALAQPMPGSEFRFEP